MKKENVIPKIATEAKKEEFWKYIISVFKVYAMHLSIKHSFKNIFYKEYRNNTDYTLHMRPEKSPYVKAHTFVSSLKKDPNDFLHSWADESN